MLLVIAGNCVVDILVVVIIIIVVRAVVVFEIMKLLMVYNSFD